MSVAWDQGYQIAGPGSLQAAPQFPRGHWADRIRQMAAAHPCSGHGLFATLDEVLLSPSQVASLLRNYDAHASHLRRLLLKTATLMPEEAVGFILENVRNEYGNGNANDRHQLQLIDVALSAGATPDEFALAQIQPGVRAYIKTVSPYYYPLKCQWSHNYRRAAIAAGAVTATELLAVKEFEAMRRAFAKLGLGHHIWFDHVAVEVEHCDESLELALYFIERCGAWDAVEFGMRGVLDANVFLYDGLLAALQP